MVTADTTDFPSGRGLIGSGKDRLSSLGSVAESVAGVQFALVRREDGLIEAEVPAKHGDD
jgi:hypothetical protein